MIREKKESYCNILLKLVQKCCNTFMNQMSEFCRETGVHGCKYICEAQRSIVERVAWAIMVVISLCTAVGMLKCSYEYYMEHFVLSVIESTHHGIWHYPFPAVTICDLNRISLKLTQEFVQNLTLPPTETKELIVQEMSLLDELMYPGKHGPHIRNNLTRLQIIFDMNNLTIPTVINAVTRSCQSLLGSCKWKSKETDCNSIFQASLTRDGICCSFNYISYDRIIKTPNPNSLSPSNVLRSLKIHKTTSCGHRNGLNVLINLDPDDYHSGIADAVGVKVMVHHPYDYPNFGTASKLISVNKYSFLTVEPAEIYATEYIQSMGICSHNNEIKAINNDNSENNFSFAKQSLINCLTECQARIIATICGCIPYYYSQNKTRSCDLRDIECLEDFKFWYDTSWPGEDMSPKTLHLKHLNKGNTPCNCKPNCKTYSYSMENSAGSLDKRIYHTGLTYTNHPSNGETWQNQSIINVFFADLVSVRFRKDTRYSWHHLFAVFGGLLGVFAGVSFMSMFEIIYFFVVRIVAGACTNGRNARIKK